MGRIAPRKRKTNRIYQPLLRNWLTLTSRTPSKSELEAADGEAEHPQHGGRVKNLLAKIWHLPDDFSWMAPLPLFHRRGVIIAAAVLLLGLLWPYSPTPPPLSSEGAPLQAELLNGAPAASQDQGAWQSYQIQAGQTLAQLFRDNSLPVNNVFAMAAVEGNDKPLSTLRAGQQVRIQRDEQGMVTELELTTPDNSLVAFSRQADGSYRRAR